jgi:hypothetical protein
MASYQVLYWHTIPVQVRAQDENGRASKEMPKRFMGAVEKASMEAGLTDDDAYLNVYRWGEQQEREGSAGEVAEAVVAELDAEQREIDWRQAVAELKAQSD